MHASIVELLEVSCEKFASRPLFGERNDGLWTWTTYGQFNELVHACTGGLARLGVERGTRVALVADNCIEWATAAHASYARGAVFVPMYTAQLPKEWQYILNDSQAAIVFAATAKEYEALVAIAPELPDLKRVIGLHLPREHADSYLALLADGREHPTEKQQPKPEDIACCIYTSGTTGEPKGVHLSHHNFCSNVAAVQQRIPLNRDRSLAFLPWAHAFGQMAELHFFTASGSCMALNDDVARLLPNLAEVSPTILIAVPRIFNRIYASVHLQMDAKPALIQSLFKKGLVLAAKKNAGESLSLLDGLSLTIADKLIFSKVRARFGGKLKLVVSGSAALNEDVARFIDALGIVVYEGYGLTETSPVISVNYEGHRKFGSVGPVIPGVEVLLDETKGDTAGEGELLVRGPNVMLGYHNRPDDTAAVLDSDGTLHTGDLARIDQDGFIFITGRIKELYKLENGKYVAPSLLEEQLKMSPWVANIVLYGSNKPHNVALIVLDPEALSRWAAKTGVPLQDAPTDPRVHDLVVDDVKRCCESFKGFEKPRGIALITEDFTSENGMLTPKMSVKRRHVLARYQDKLDALY